jgi:hypothetical protein
MNSPPTSRNPNPKQSKKTITQNMQNRKHYVLKFQITKERYEITKLGFYTQSTN